MRERVETPDTQKSRRDVYLGLAVRVSAAASVAAFFRPAQASKERVVLSVTKTNQLSRGSERSRGIEAWNFVARGLKLRDSQSSERVHRTRNELRRHNLNHYRRAFAVQPRAIDPRRESS